MQSDNESGSSDFHSVFWNNHDQLYSESASSEWISLVGNYWHCLRVQSLLLVFCASTQRAWQLEAIGIVIARQINPNRKSHRLERTIVATLHIVDSISRTTKVTNPACSHPRYMPRRSHEQGSILPEGPVSSTIFPPRVTSSETFFAQSHSVFLGPKNMPGYLG